MKCPKCKGDMKKGEIQVIDGRLVCATSVAWVPEEEKGKLFRKNAISLDLRAEGHYCPRCGHVVGLFQPR